MRKIRSIPVNPMANEFGLGMAIDKMRVKDLHTEGLEDAKRSHREDGHSFFLLERGNVSIEIDFQKYKIRPSSVLYIHPNQVHRIITFENVTVTSWSISNENLIPEYLKILEEITPAMPLVLNKETFTLISETATLCLKLFDRKNSKLYYSILKDNCNLLVALVASLYLERSKATYKASRPEYVAKAFKEILECNYTTIRQPAAYAQQLNISTPYLNQCIKNTTGYSVSHYIQQRVILEAKRLLSHSNKSVKEIATLLGYDDYPYFSRLFTKVTGMTALAFRNKNYD